MALIPAAGCQQLNLTSKLTPSKLPQATPEHPVKEVIALWEPAEGTGMDGAPCRGFAGQIMFFSHGIVEPVRVDGDVTIVVFDDQGDAQERARPLHTFRFEEGVWQKYLRATKTLGATYQIFIPYTRTGAHQATCSLRVMYQPKNGIPIYSKMASIILAGSKRSSSETAARPQSDEAANSLRTTPSYTAPQVQIEELRQLAPQVPQGQEPPRSSSVLTMPHPANPDWETERQRLKMQVQRLLGEAETDETMPRQPWEPVHQRVVPQPVQQAQPPVHPLRD